MLVELTIVLLPYIKIWDEAMLSATLWFLKQEIGIHKIWCHSYETAALLKRITYTRPPRSLYTNLPKKFCFLQSEEAPGFLRQDREFRKHYRRINHPQWSYLEV